MNPDRAIAEVGHAVWWVDPTEGTMRGVLRGLCGGTTSVFHVTTVPVSGCEGVEYHVASSRLFLCRDWDPALEALVRMGAEGPE